MTHPEEPKARPLRIPETERTFGQALRWARGKRKMTLRKLAEAVGVDAAFVCDLEHDRRQTKKVVEFAKALGVPVADLESRQGVTEDLTDWLSKRPDVLRLIREIRACQCKPLILKELARLR